MKIQNDRILDKNIEETKVFLIGDVRNVIFSCANRTKQIPYLFGGFGACGLDNPATVGEGIIFRGNISSTPPDSGAGIKVNFRLPLETSYTPFFVGWNGIPSFTVNFNSKTGITLKQLYQNIFSDFRNSKNLQDFEYIFLEIVGLFCPKDIFDRALQKRVDSGGVLTILPENAKDFFKPRIIYNDLVKRNAFTEDLFPLCIAGAGHFCEDRFTDRQSLCENIFYVAPQEIERLSANDLDNNDARILTHSHALGWYGETSEIENLLFSIRGELQSSDEPKSIENAVNELLEYHPNYLVHLDDWSILRAATVKVFLADSDNFIIKSVTDDTD